MWGITRSDAEYLRKDHEKLVARVDVLESRAAGYDVTLAVMTKDVAYIRTATDDIRNTLRMSPASVVQQR